MTKTLGSTLLFAVLLCGGAQLALAQDQNTNAPADQAPAAAPQTTPEKPAKKHHGHMDACKDDIKTYCADAKGHKAVHECLEKNEDKLSDACKAERAKMMKKHHKKEMKGEQAPSSQAPADQQPAAPQNQ